MKGFLAMAFLPLVCLVGLVILIVMVYLIVRSATSRAAEFSKLDNPPETDSESHWTHSDLVATTTQTGDIGPKNICPACGGPNSAAEEICSFCGRKLE